MIIAIDNFEIVIHIILVLSNSIWKLDSYNDVFKKCFREEKNETK